MLQLGDIAAINGIRVPPVDVVTGGSPCQDVSVAGARKGIRHKDLGDEAETRSGLFMEQIRIIRELRNADRKRGRAGEFVRPRFMLWENVPGAFSSNGGRDFKAVLEETIRLAEPDAPDIPCPKKWPMADAYFGNGWSVAYRVFDAQFWGVAQRRRRICLVADFGGFAAPEILFVRDSLSGHFTESGTPEKRTAGSAGDGAHPAIAGSSPIDGEPNAIAQGFGETGIGYWQSGIQTLRAEGENRPSRPSNVVVQNGVKCLNPWDSQSGRVYDESGIWHSLIANENAGMQRDAVFCSEAIPIHDKATRYQGGGAARNGDGSGNGLGIGKDGDPCFTLTSADRHAVYDARGNGDGKTVCTLTGDHQNRVTDYTAIVAAVDCRCGTESDVNGTLQAKGSGGYSLNTNITVRCGTNVRRITPLECERLQGYPDGWTALEPVRDMSDEELAFWRRERLEKGIRERRLRKNEAGVYEVWRYLTPKNKGFDPNREKDEKGGYWLNTGRPYREMGKERMIRWYNGRFCSDSDSARYRALGNSIALPPWKWVLKRISAQYERDATLGSLFDGIGGFPFLWEQINGKGSALWASEIEEFPIAVTRYHFGGG